MAERPIVLAATNLTKVYPIRRGVIWKRTIGEVRAVDGVTLTLRAGESVGIVGESGSGKSTTARLLLGLEAPTSGSVEVTGDDLAGLSARQLRRKRRDIQIVLQDPYLSLNPRMTISAILREPFAIHPDALAPNRSSRQAVAGLLEQVGLGPEFANRYPHQFSGGQRQRIGVARAIALRPKIVVADEPVSALDVSVRAQIMNLLLDLRDELGLSYVFISHDLAVVRQIADKVAVMYSGSIVETGGRDDIYSRPAHPYTRSLLAAARRRAGAVPSSLTDTAGRASGSDATLGAGCRFRWRCWKAYDACSGSPPKLEPVPGSSPDHLVACYCPDAGDSGE
ncbi:MAG: oligopeptide/dipeptide ABC transporter ATP-binding protein [Candidatus Nanopelagicales bacterium]|nr:ATP-binding cassette domain-containing protein [Candidatus Nanopelagicales bacterium]MDZ4249288.1 oligopeptide/dipeptide ABC transporter ATP-binding protein [Candidatus Nanopelagicales bacterium]